MSPSGGQVQRRSTVAAADRVDVNVAALQKETHALQVSPFRGTQEFSVAQIRAWVILLKGSVLSFFLMRKSTELAISSAR